MKKMLKRFWKEEEGAAMVEYTILIGLITAAVVGLVLTVGQWIIARWTELNTALT